MDSDDLYGLPLDRFVPERAALARALRADGQREEAASVGALRKPSVAAWAVNQLVRTQRRAVGELFEAGDALRQAHADVLSGRAQGERLREATERERAATEVLLSATRGLLSSEGHELSPAMIDRVADTLHAAALDEQSRASVEKGRLERELRHVGLGVASTGGGAQRKAPSRQPKQKGRERPQARTAARGSAAAGRRRADRAARAVRVAEERRDRAAQALREAEETLERSRSEAAAAVDAERQAQERLEGT